MSGFRIVTDLDVDKAVKIARRAAKDLDFGVATVDDLCFSATKGSLGLSIFLGAFIAYCDFKVTFEEVGRDKVEVSLERNKPWWTGLIGISRVKSAAKALADAMADGFDEGGGRIIREEEF